MKRRNRNVEQSSLSFLDAISCGFGAIIILVVISKSAPPSVEEPTPVVNAAQAQQLSLLAQQTAGEREAVEAELAAAEMTGPALTFYGLAPRAAAQALTDMPIEEMA